VRRAEFASRIAVAKFLLISTFALLYACNASRYAVRSAEIVLVVVVAGTVVLVVDASSASAAVAPLDNTIAAAEATNVFLMNCFTISPSFGGFMLV